MSEVKINELKDEKPFLLPFVINLMVLLSVGFISGAIVHVGFNNDNNIYYLTFGAIGSLLFVGGNYLQEKYVLKREMEGLKTFQFLLITLGMSIAVGMISGGLQHFVDFPQYATYLIPIGIITSTIFFLLKNEYRPLSKYLPLIAISLGIAVVTFFGAGQLAKNIEPGIIGHSHTSDTSHNHNSTALSPSHNMSGVVKDEESFIFHMIPHHLEAINTSRIIVGSTENQELKSFAQNVIEAQTKEIDQMKIWYKSWYNKDYIDNSDYVPMMTDMIGKGGTQLDNAYIRGMIEHHQGAVSMAEKLQTISNTKAELKQLAKNIIRDQNREIDQLNNWLNQYNQNNPSDNSLESSKKSEHSDDGHDHSH